MISVREEEIFKIFGQVGDMFTGALEQDSKESGSTPSPLKRG